MKLSNKAIQEIKASKRLRNRLALDLDIAAGTLNRWVASNDDSLTKAKCLQIIREETGLTDSEILEETVAA